MGKLILTTLALFGFAFASCAEASEETAMNVQETYKMEIKVNGQTLTATMADNSSAAAFKELLEKGDLTIEMSDYGNFEKVGDIGQTLPRNDENITTEPGDIILYLGNRITIYYDTNTWNFTRLGKIDNISQSELKSLLGDGDITVTFSLGNSTSINSVSGAAKAVASRVYTLGGITVGEFSGEARLSSLPQGSYIVKTTLDDGTTITRKITL